MNHWKYTRKLSYYIYYIYLDIGAHCRSFSPWFIITINHLIERYIIHFIFANDGMFKSNTIKRSQQYFGIGPSE